jgi:hypothetical protein
MMYNLSPKFNTFYNEHVVLPKEETQTLREKKDLNIQRLKDGLAEYNEEQKTDIKLLEHIVQGSVAMSTIVQNEENNYDIDVAIIFDKAILPDGTTATKNIIVNVLKRKCKQFSVEPMAKTNCIRIEYTDGYHIDFAVYRRSTDVYGEYLYEHCGSEWRRRNPRDINTWFREQNNNKDGELRVVVRLLKMYCTSRSSWKMPAGIVLTVLCNECFYNSTQTDVMFYETIKSIRDRLAYNKEVNNPADTSQTLLLIAKDDEKIKNLYQRLDSAITNLQVLFDSACTEKQAMDAWKDFFSHDYWNESQQVQKSQQLYTVHSTNESLEADEDDFIEDLYPVINAYYVEVECDVKFGNGTVQKLHNMTAIGRHVPLGCELTFRIVRTNVPFPYTVLWKVRNCGPKAKEHGFRGQIFDSTKKDRGNSQSINYEKASFEGNHFVECYVIKNNICVAYTHVNVPIG